MKIKKEKMKDIVLIFSAFVLIVVGYLNYNYDDKEHSVVEVASTTNDINLGDVQLVNSEPAKNISAIVSNEDLSESDNLNNNQDIENKKVESDKQVEDNSSYFEETRIQRDKMYSEMLETYQSLINNTQTPEDQKAIAVQEISNMTNTKNGIMIAENLIKNKGFEDVVILVNNSAVSVIVKSLINLNQEQISKIQNIVERELKVEASNINITNK